MNFREKNLKRPFHKILCLKKLYLLKLMLPQLRRRKGEEEDVWKKEQAYLKALSDQYCIEKYQDSYDLMCE